MSELVSILIPAYNAECWIVETIESAMAQTWHNKEIIVVDDGSSDQTYQLAHGFSSKGVHVVTQDRVGACAARNRALALAQGTHIQFLDADDVLHPEKIARQLRRSETGHSSRLLLTSAWGRFYSSARCARFAPDTLWQDLQPADWIIRKFVDNVFMNPASWLVSRRLIDLAGPWDVRLTLNDDGEYICRLVSRSDQILFASQARSYYRVGNVGSLSAETSMEASNSLFLSMTLCIEYLRQLEDSERARGACIKHLQDSLAHFYPERPDLVGRSCELARSLGGHLFPVPERAHFRFARHLLGWKRAKYLRALYNEGRTQFAKRLERLLARRAAE